MSSALSSGNGGGASSRYFASINSSSGRSGTSSFGRIDVERPGRLDSKSRGGGSSLYMVTASFLERMIHPGGFLRPRNRHSPRSRKRSGTSSRRVGRVL